MGRFAVALGRYGFVSRGKLMREVKVVEVFRHFGQSFKMDYELNGMK